MSSNTDPVTGERVFGDVAYATAEEAALAGWSESPSAHARVADVKVVGDKADVHLLLDDYEDWVACERAAGGWREAMSGPAPHDWWLDH